MAISNHVAEIVRQMLSSLTGGWCYDSTSSLFCNTVHLYIWGTFFVLPLILGFISSSGIITLSMGIILGYVMFIMIFFIILKLLLVYLHNIFDTGEPIIDTKKNVRKTSKTKNSEHSRAFCRAESNAIEMLDLATTEVRLNRRTNLSTNQTPQSPNNKQVESRVLQSKLSEKEDINKYMDAINKLEPITLNNNVESSTLFYNNSITGTLKMTSIFEDENTSSTGSSQTSLNPMLTSTSESRNRTTCERRKSLSNKRRNSSQNEVKNIDCTCLLPTDSLEMLNLDKNK